MKNILSKLITVTPFIIGIAILAYIAQEIIEDVYSEALSDFVYPIAGLLMLIIIWIYLVPEIKKQLQEYK